MALSSELPKPLRHSRAVEVLERSLLRDRLGHGILLHGENLSSLETIVRAIATDRLKTKNDPYLHPDCFTLRPSGKARKIRIGSKADESNSMRKLVIDVQKTANQGGRKVGIIFEADRMNVQSANAFLKTLEEPPAETTLFLITTRPYDLLDTIRSRCLNFRIPSQAEEVEHSNWEDWAIDYRAWLGRLLKDPDKESVPHIMLGAYGLMSRFQSILSEVTKYAWAEQKKELAEHVSNDEKEAMEVGLSRGYRKQFYGEIESLTAGFCRDVEVLNPGRLPVNAQIRVIPALENSAGLLELNLNEAAALELFFLKSLRLWTAK